MHRGLNRAGPSDELEAVAILPMHFIIPPRGMFRLGKSVRNPENSLQPVETMRLPAVVIPATYQSDPGRMRTRP